MHCSKSAANILIPLKDYIMSENNNVVAGTVDLNLVKAFVEEWSKSGYKGTSGKPPFSFAAVGLREGVKLYVNGKVEPVGEIAPSPVFVKTNTVELYKLGTFPTLDAAAFEYKKSIGTPVKKGNGWITFQVKLVANGKEAVLPIRTLWERWPNVGENLSSLVEKANEPKAKPAKPAKPAQKLIDESVELRKQVAELQKQLAELSKK
jgi:hypothetical protein